MCVCVYDTQLVNTTSQDRNDHCSYVNASYEEEEPYCFCVEVRGHMRSPEVKKIVKVCCKKSSKSLCIFSFW